MDFQFKFGNEHHCNTAVIGCVDFRFNQEMVSWIKEEFNEEAFDLWTVAGSAKFFISEEFQDFKEFRLKKINDVSCNLHDIHRLVIINHADCGAYGGRKIFSDPAAEKRQHLEDLDKARKLLQERFPKLEIIKAYADLDDAKQKLEFEVIKE